MQEVTQEMTCLLTEYYGDYYLPENWELSPKSTNFIAKISKGEKYIFERKFLKTYALDENVVFKKSHFVEGDIVEQKCVFKKGTKEEILFHGFFVIHLEQGQILGEEISQKDALEYFDFREKFPDVAENQKRKLRVKLGTVVRKLTAKYGEELVVDILTDIISDYFPNVEE